MRYSRLNRKQKDLVARAFGVAVGGLSNSVSLGQGYESVKRPYSQQRRASVVELTGEDSILPAYDRDRIINMHRDMIRNSPTRVAQDQQLRVNVVGTVGGKLYANFPAAFRDSAAEVMHFINHVWQPACEFTFSHSFNWLLKTTLSALDSNGNVILVFDDGFLTGKRGTGKIRAFEGDEIANIPDEEFKRAYPGCVQSQGFIYNAAGQFCGCFVSTSQRGRREFKTSDGVIVLKRDPAAFTAKENWVKLGDEGRFNQGRAVSPVTAAINCLVDLHEITASETQAAKINAQLVGQILRDASSEGDAASASVGFDDDVAAGELPETITFTTKELSSIGARFDQMPEGMKVDLLDTKRPNPNMAAYIEFLTGLAGGARGLARVYSTLKAQTSYTAYRGEQCMTAPTFEERQKDLERNVCDPFVRLAIKWGAANGYLNLPLPEGWENMLSFNWPKMREVNEVDAQNALALKLKNGVTTLHRELAPGEYERIFEQRRAEKADYDAAGLIYPGTETASGMLLETSTSTEPAADGEEDTNQTEEE